MAFSIHPMRSRLLELPRVWKRVIVLTADIALCILTVSLGYYLRLGTWVPLVGWPTVTVLVSLALMLPSFVMTGMYGVVVRHAGTEVIGRTTIACGLYGLCFAAVITAYGIDNIPRTVGIIQPCLLFISVTASRLAASFLLSGRYRRLRRRGERGRALIYGAGSSGQQLVIGVADSVELQIVGFLDDDRSLHNSRVRGLRVFDPADLAAHVERHRITDVLMALPSASRVRRNEIISRLAEVDVNVRTLPGLLDLAHGTVQANDLRELTIDDLLGREPVADDRESLARHIAGNIVMVTGAGGSIGSELARQIHAMKPAKLLLVDSSEFALYSINNHLESHRDGIAIPLLASVCDAARMRAIMTGWNPAIVFHAAAYKHVPLVEHNPLQGLRNNVFGTLVVAEEAMRQGVRDFVLISTDKAVRPTNTMGASKRLAEMLLQGLTASGRSTTRFSMVRFGNVLGSSGSVVPLFREQIRKGGPITLTHREITRYFMTIPEATHLVLQAGAMARGGEVFVLDMGEPVKIYDLACNLIKLSGLSVRDDVTPDGEIEIVTVGLRPGEKLYEELLIGDNPMPTNHPRIMMANEPFIPLSELRPKLDLLATLIDGNDAPRARKLLQELVSEYRPSTEVVDFIYLARDSNQTPMPRNDKTAKSVVGRVVG